MKYDPSFNVHTHEQNLAEHEFINQTPKPPSTELKKYRIKTKDASSWQSIHKELIAFGTNAESIPQRTCTCANFRGQSETTGTYEISEVEALELQKNPNIEWVTLDPMYHEEARVPVEPTSSNPTPDIQRFGTNVKNYRTLSSISKVTPVQVASSLDAVSGSPNWIKVSAAHPNTDAMNYWAIISSLLVDYAIYPSAPASASTQDPLRESLQSATSTVTLATSGWYKIEVVADGMEAYLEVKDNNQNWYDQKPGYLIPLDQRGGGHRYDCFNIGHKAGGTTLDITYKVKNGTASDPNKRNWENNPAGIGWRVMRIDMAAPNVANPSLHSWPYATSSSGIPAAETNRTGYQLKRCEAETTNPFGSNSLDILDADVTYKDDGMDVDCIIVDSGVWGGHPEFCTNDNDPPNFIPGNVLNRSAKSGVLDLILDAPAYLDPEYWEQNPSYLMTRWDGTPVPTEESARDWWNDPSKRSSQYKSRYAPAATFAILINPSYTRANNCGDDESATYKGDHGTKCASLVYGKNFGWAFNCNKWALRMAFGWDTGSPSSNNWEHQKIFHESKPDNPKFSGNTAKNKTVSSNSWGMRQDIVHGKYWGCGYDFKINFRGTETTYTRNNTDVYGNSWTGTNIDDPSTYLPNPDDANTSTFGKMYQYSNRALAVSNPYVTHIPACLRCADGQASMSVGGNPFGYGWFNQKPHTAEQGTNNATSQAEWDSAVDSMNSGIYYVFAAGNDSNYIADKDDPDYNNWATQASGINIPGIGQFGGTESKHYFHRAAFPAGIMYESTGLNKAFVIGALDDQYKDSMVFSEDTILNDYSNDAQGDSTELLAHNGPYGRMYTTWYGAPEENPGFTVSLDRPADYGGGTYTTFDDRFTGWGGQKWAQYRRDYSTRGSGISFWAPADSTLAATINTGYGAGQDTLVDSSTAGYAGAFTIPRNDTKPGSGYYADGYMNGTSAACPVAAGLIACAMQQNRTTEAAHMGGYLSNSIPVDTNCYVGEVPNSADSPNWTGLHGNMGIPIRQIKEVEASKKHNNTPNPSLYTNSGIDATRNLNERFTITSATGVTMMIRGIREFSASDVSVPVSLRVVGGGSVGVRYYPVHTTNSLTSSQRGEIRFRIKSGSNDQILEVSNNSGSTWTYFTIRVVNGYFTVGYQGQVYYALNVADDVSLPEDTTPTYILTTNLLTVNEGSQLITTVQTTYVSENTTLYWSLSGTGITSGDFSAGSLIGQVSIAANGNAVFNHTLANDLSTEGTETINIKLFTDASRNTQVATANVSINDTSKGATYSIAPDELSINEGETVRYTLTTTNVQDGTVLYTDLTGISANDLSSGQLQSSWSVFNNTFFADYTLAEDSTTEGNEVITFKVYTDSARTNEVASNSSLTVVDTSVDASPSYSLSCTPTGSINEGSNIVATVATTNVTTGTVLYWEISGANITGADFTTSLTGSSSVNSSGNAVWTNTLANDVTTEGDETFNLKVYTDSGRTNQVASTWTQVIKDTSLGITYGIAAAKTSYNEGETMYAAVSTTNATVGSTLYWKIDPISNTLNASDFSGGLEGSGNLDSNGQFTFTRVISNDTTTEGNETFAIKLYTDSSRSNLVATSPTVTIVDTSLDAPTYTVTPSSTTLDEGDNFTITVTTTNVSAGTTLYWKINEETGTISAADFNGGILDGSGNVNSQGAFLFGKSLVNDLTTEGEEKFTVKLYTDATFNLLVATSPLITINDTSETPAVPSYSITPSKTSINEGDSFTTTVTTSNVAQGTTLYWKINEETGTISAADFSSGALDGSDTTSNSTITFSHTIAADATTEGEEKFTVKLYTDATFNVLVATSPLITINDTSQPSGSPTYVLSANTNPIDEGSSLIITATTTDVAENTTLYWSFSGTGIDAADFMEGTLESDTVIPANGVNNWSTSIRADALTEGNETLLVKLFTDSARTTQVGNTLNVTINDTSTTPTPTYALNTNVSQIDEGGAWTTQVVTGNVAQGTTLYWSLSGTNLDASDFSSGALTGDDVTAANGTFTFSHTTSLDTTTEGDETAVIKLFTDSARTNEVATKSVLIKDTSTDAGNPTYVLSTTSTRFNEGDSFTTTVTTTGVAEGTVLHWALSGTGVSEDDFNLANTTTGSGTITSNTFTFSHTIREDAITEGDEVISIKLYIDSNRTIQVGNTLSVTIRDSSQPGYCIRVTSPSSAAYILTGADRNGSI